MEKRKQITIKLPGEDADRLYKMARENRLTLAEQARRFLYKGMSADAYKNEEAQILANMQHALREVLDPQVERMVKITVKNSIASSVNLLLTSMLLTRLCSEESRPKLEMFMEEARRMGIRFVQLGKGSVEEFLKSSMEKVNAIWEGD